jgi:hypothetical protein
MNEDMNAGTGGRRGRRRRAGALAAAVAGIILLAAGCGGGGSPTAAGSRNYQKALAFVQCMRTHGVPSFPDPTTQETISASQVNLSSPQVLSAYGACNHLLPAGGGLQLSGAQEQAVVSKLLKLATCMRAHGIASFPDPTVQDGSVHVSLAGVDTSSSFYQSAWQACRAGTHGSSAGAGTPTPKGGSGS